jgi:hypothetical protein
VSESSQSVCEAPCLGVSFDCFVSQDIAHNLFGSIGLVLISLDWIGYWIGLPLSLMV